MKHAHDYPKRGAGRVYSHDTPTPHGLHCSDAINARAVRYDGYVKRAMRAGASEERVAAIFSPPPIQVLIFGDMRREQTDVSSRIGGFIRASSHGH